MHRVIQLLTIWLFGISLALGVGACAEETDSVDPPEAAAEVPVSKRQAPAVGVAPLEPPTHAKSTLSGPDVFLLPDKDGKLRKVLGFPYEDFRRAWLQDQQPGENGPPKYAIRAVKISGTATDDRVGMRVEFQLHTNTSGWLRVPLQLPKLVLQKVEFDQQSRGECLVFDSENGGYVAWLEGQPGKTRTITLEGSIRLQESKDESSFALRLPHSVASEMDLEIPLSNLQLEASKAAQFSKISTQGHRTQLRLEGLAIPLRFSWRRRQKGTPRGELVLEAVQQTVVQINRRRLRYDTALQVNSFGSPMDVVRVRLPQGTTLQQLSASDQGVLSITEVPAAEGLDRIAEIKLSQPRRKPWSISLRADEAIEDSNGESTHSLTGFEVLGAYRQSGTVALQLEDQLQAYYDLQGDIKQIRVDELPKADVGNNYSAGFSYSRFPWSLNVHAMARQRRVRVRPEFTLHLGENQTRLDVVLDYRFAGARTFDLRMKLRGWKLSDERIESGGVVDNNARSETKDGSLVLPLVNPDVQQAKLSFSLQREAQSGSIEIPLPEMVDAFVLPGKLTVTSDTSLHVVPDSLTMVGITALSAAGEPETSGDQSRDALHFRTNLPRPTLGAMVAPRERRIVAHMQTHVDVKQDVVRVTEQLRYQVDFRPVSQLLLRMPRELWRNETLIALVDGKEIPLSLGGFDETDSTDEQRDPLDRQVVASLRSPTQKPFVLEISYEVTPNQLVVGETTPLVLPLATPEDLVSTNEISVSVDESVRATLQQSSGKSAWTPQTAEDLSAEPEFALRLHSQVLPSQLSLELQRLSPEQQSQSVLERAWLQTWLVGSVQQDRAVLQFRPQRSTIVARLPSQLTQQTVEVLLDHEAVRYETLDNNRIAVALPADQQQGSHTLEFRYQRNVSLSGWEELHAEIPQLEGRSTGARTVWQLILPSGWCATTVPKQLVADYRVGWKNFRWGRQPTCSQTDLQLWTGAAPTLPPPPSSVEYIFRSSGTLPMIEILVMPRAWLCLAGGSVVFGIGLLWMYTNLARQRAAWLAIAIGLLALVASYPEVVVLVIQTILLGGVMTLTAMVLRHTLQRQPRQLSSPSTIAPTIAPTSTSAPVGIAPTDSTPTESWSAGHKSDPSAEQTITQFPSDDPPS